MKAEITLEEKDIIQACKEYAHRQGYEVTGAKAGSRSKGMDQRGESLGSTPVVVLTVEPKRERHLPGIPGRD